MATYGLLLPAALEARATPLAQLLVGKGALLLCAADVSRSFTKLVVAE